MENIENKIEYICIDEFTIGTKKPKTFRLKRKYKLPKDVGAYYVGQGKLKQL